MIRVLHVVGGMNQGGTENLLMNLYRNIDKEKIQFDFLVNREGIFDDEIKENGGKIYYIPALQKVGLFKYINNLDRFLKEHNEYKIIHSHINQVTGLILERANKANIPVRIAHSHSSKSCRNLLIKTYKKFLGNKIKNNATCLLACSQEAGKWLYGKNNEDFEVIKNSIDLKKYTFNENIRTIKRNELNINDSTFIIGHVGRFSDVKNHKFILDIFNEFLKLYDDSNLILVGKGELKEKIIEYSKKLKIYNKIIWLENRKDVNELLQAFDYFLFPSKYEGLPLSLIEAQSTGLKCIVSSDVIPEEVKVTDLVQFYSLNNSPQQWAMEIFEKMNYKRTNCINEIEKNGYDIETTANYLTQLYRDLIKNI